ncbi:malonyl-ACP O-methyltransferase BioC [Colwelliaceae bacterium BS250]
MHQTLTIKSQIAKSFGLACHSYDLSARLQRYSGQLLMADLPANNNSVVLDLGCGTGFFSHILARKYSQVFGVDISSDMLNFAKQNRSSAIHWLNADIQQLPFNDGSVDIIYSNLAIQWCEPLIEVLDELKRVLKPGGVIVFSSLLNGTLTELQQAWASVDDDKHIIDFKHFNDFESAIAQTDLQVQRLEQQAVVLEYDNVKHLATELKDLGANKVPNKRNKGLAGKSSWQKMTKAYEVFKDDNGAYPATYQLCMVTMSKAHA